jgi:threonine synthase
MYCTGCGWSSGGDELPFACPQRDEKPECDHVLAMRLPAGSFVDKGERNPFIRFRGLLFPYRWARAQGMEDSRYVDLVSALDDQIALTSGHGFETTPMVSVPVGGTDEVLAKVEVGQVGYSHKARHLMGIAIYLTLRQALGLPTPKGMLAIASCGNAALAAAVVARAWGRPLEVFIPEDAKPSVVTALSELGAIINVCRRTDGVPGDPCYTAFRESVRRGAVPFCCQGPDNGLTIEGGLTLAYEWAAQLAESKLTLQRVFVQVGGGAFATAIARGFQVARTVGLIANLPSFNTVQTSGCFPLARAYERVKAVVAQVGIEEALQRAAQDRASFMWPWENDPKSLAHGILDDETYDWLAIVRAMLETSGNAWVVSEAELQEAREWANRAGSVSVSHTGAAGLAGFLHWRGTTEPSYGITGVILSGRG